MGSITLLWTK